METIRLAELLSVGLPAASEADWAAAAEKALKGAGLDRITARTAEGIVVPPLSPARRDARPVAGRAAGAPWCILQPVTVDDARAANARLLDELSGGCGGADLSLPAGGLDEADLLRLFDGVYTDLVAVHLSLPGHDPAALGRIAGFLAERRGAGTGGSLHLGVDPFAATGGPTPAERLAGAVHVGGTAGLPGTFVACRGQLWHGAGASSVQQIAVALAATAEMLRLADDGGLCDPAELFVRIEYRLVADQNQFLTIARLRAFRRLHALLGESCGFAPARAFVVAEGARRMMTRRDPWVNILRSTIAAFAGAVGGADAVLTLPHTALLGLPDDDARRLSRNVQTVLLEESNLHRVADPVAGAGGVEALTDALAEGAWDEFRAIEREGGLAASLASGALASRVAAYADASRKAVARRREPITGTSIFPLISERSAAVAGPVPAARAEPAPVAPHRAAEPWEALRDASDAALAATGVRPRILLVTLGPVAAHTLRANWAKNLFEAGGIEAIFAAGEGDLASALDAAGTPLACLCSSDALYAEKAAEVAAALKAAGAAPLLLAGRPGEAEPALTAAGIDGYVHEGLDMVALLAGLHDRLGVTGPREV